jgi:hypothetical protein
MSDLTPDTLAALAYRLECNGEAAAAIVCLHHASSWRANLAFANEDNTSMNSRLVDAEARIEAANKTWVGMWQEEHDQCIEALARIEALEKTKGLVIPKCEWSICARHNRAYWTEEGCLSCRIEALERVRRATEVINTTTHEASKGVYLGKPCAHGNLPVYPTHARWCDECWQELEDALAVLRGE